MKRISAKSKLGRHFVNAYEISAWHTIKDVYTKPSTAKQAAFERCQWQCEAENGDRLRVISFTCQAFTVAFITATHELRVITRRNDYIVYFGDKL